MVRYVEDGAADASVTEDPTDPVKAIVDQGAKSLPGLIECLSSREHSEATVTTFPNNAARSAPVTLGYVCLDVLMNITKGDEVFVKECSDDGFGACVNAGFYFRPDVYQTNGARAPVVVRNVQKRWSEALTRKLIRFEYPSWWQATSR